MTDYYSQGISYDTCEKNFQHTIYVAELANTLSSLPLILLSYWGWIKLRYADGDIHLKLTYLALSLVGVGSSVAHCFLLGAWLDELPLFCLFFAFAQCLIRSFPEQPNKKWTFEVSVGVRISYFNFTLYLMAVISILAYFFESTIIIFHIFYAILLIYVAFRSCEVCRVSNSIDVRDLYLRFALTCFVGCIFWWMEVLLCEDLGFIGFHAFWHLLLSYSLYIWVVFILAFAGQKKQKYVQVQYNFKGLIPTIIYLER